MTEQKPELSPNKLTVTVCRSTVGALSPNRHTIRHTVPSWWLCTTESFMAEKKSQMIRTVAGIREIE